MAYTFPLVPEFLRHTRYAGVHQLIYTLTVIVTFPFIHRHDGLMLQPEHTANQQIRIAYYCNIVCQVVNSQSARACIGKRFVCAQCHALWTRDVKSSLRPRPRGQNIWPRPRPRSIWPRSLVSYRSFLHSLQSLAPVSNSGKDLGFDHNVFFMASALDPNFGFRWLQDHPGSAADRDEMKVKVTGMQTAKSLVTSCYAISLTETQLKILTITKRL